MKMFALFNFCVFDKYDKKLIVLCFKHLKHVLIKRGKVNKIKINVSFERYTVSYIYLFKL